MPSKPCLDCKRITKASRCPECEAKRQEARDESEPWRKVYKTSRWAKTRSLVLARDEACYVCGATEGLQVHHLQKLRHGGKPYDHDNLVALCPKCHSKAEKQAL